jgi:predicted Fe-Mo cluster-binding NifX family protein
MRIAVPTNDGVTLSEHFGRSAAFLIFELENGRITKRETRPNRAHHAAADGECHHGGGGERHSHAGILTVLAGCDVVLWGGMGGRRKRSEPAASLRSRSPLPVQRRSLSQHTPQVRSSPPPTASAAAVTSSLTVWLGASAQPLPYGRGSDRSRERERAVFM